MTDKCKEEFEDCFPDAANHRQKILGKIRYADEAHFYRWQGFQAAYNRTQPEARASEGVGAKTILRFGKGDKAVSHGFYDNEPAVFIETCDHIGKVGEEINPQPPRNSLTDKAIILVFPTIEQAKWVDDSLCNTVRTHQPIEPSADVVERVARAISIEIQSPTCLNADMPVAYQVYRRHAKVAIEAYKKAIAQKEQSDE